VVQLLLVGYVLKFAFLNISPVWDLCYFTLHVFGCQPRSYVSPEVNLWRSMGIFCRCALEKLSEAAWREKDVIEARLMLGQTPKEAMSDIAKSSIRSALIPIINSMSIVGLVSLPGMMTGQILAGADPAEAVKYQILILFMIAAGVGFGSIAAIKLALHRLFDERHRLRLDRLTTKS